MPKGLKRFLFETSFDSPPLTRASIPKADTFAFPVLMSIVSTISKFTFSFSSFQNTRKFVADFECTAGEVKYLFITAHNAPEKEKILALIEAKNFKVKCAATETETKGVTFGVPLSET